MQKTTADVVLKVGRKEAQRVARESGGLGAKPPAGSRGRVPGNTAAELDCHLCCNVVDTRVLHRTYIYSINKNEILSKNQYGFRH